MTQLTHSEDGADGRLPLSLHEMLPNQRKGSGDEEPGAAQRRAFQPYHSKSVPKPENLVAQAEKSLTITTMMLRNIPNKYTQSTLLEEIDDMGFAGTYSFFYLPMDVHNRSNVGYAFIDFNTSAAAARFNRVFKDHRFQKFQSRKISSVCTAHVQGLDENLRHFENRAVTHARNDQYRPVVLKGNQRVDFVEAVAEAKARIGQKMDSTSQNFAAPPHSAAPKAARAGADARQQKEQKQHQQHQQHQRHSDTRGHVGEGRPRARTAHATVQHGGDLSQQPPHLQPQAFARQFSDPQQHQHHQQQQSRAFGRQVSEPATTSDKDLVGARQELEAAISQFLQTCQQQEAAYAGLHGGLNADAAQHFRAAAHGMPGMPAFPEGGRDVMQLLSLRNMLVDRLYTNGQAYCPGTFLHSQGTFAPPASAAASSPGVPAYVNLPTSSKQFDSGLAAKLQNYGVADVGSCPTPRTNKVILGQNIDGLIPDMLPCLL